MMRAVLLALALAGCASTQERQRLAYETEHVALWRDCAEASDAERRGDHDGVQRSVADAWKHLTRMRQIREGGRR